MRILVTNDDGIHAPQLHRLAQWAQQLGQVTVVAPKREQSGKSQGIELHEPFEVLQLEPVPGITGYSVDSTPADCIRYAVFGLKQSFDLVLSGVNPGYNIGTDVMYSGTVGAAFEAVSLGMKAVALSTCPEYIHSVHTHFDALFDFILGHGLLEHNDAYNVNIPPHGRAIRITRQGGHYYSDDFVPVGGDLVLARGKCVYQDSHDDSLDTDAVMHGLISVTPLTILRTHMDAYRALCHLQG